MVWLPWAVSSCVQLLIKYFPDQGFGFPTWEIELAVWSLQVFQIPISLLPGLGSLVGGGGDGGGAAFLFTIRPDSHLPYPVPWAWVQPGWLDPNSPHPHLQCSPVQILLFGVVLPVSKAQTFFPPLLERNLQRSMVSSINVGLPQQAFEQRVL